MSRTFLSLSVASILALGALALPAHADPLTIYQIASLSSPNLTQYYASSGGSCPVPVVTLTATHNNSNPGLSTGNQVIFYNSTSTTYNGTVSYDLHISAYGFKPSATVSFQPGDVTSSSGSETVNLDPTQSKYYDTKLSGTAGFVCLAGNPAYTGHASSYVYGTFPGGPTNPGTIVATFTVNPPQ